jgi:hypothetical protein
MSRLGVRVFICLVQENFSHLNRYKGHAISGKPVYFLKGTRAPKVAADCLVHITTKEVRDSNLDWETGYFDRGFSCSP